MFSLLILGISTNDLDLHRASIATEIHFLYTSDTTNIDELFSPDSKSQMGLGKWNSLTHKHTNIYLIFSLQSSLI